MIDSIDDLPLDRGKYNGMTPNEIAVDDPGYIVWLYENLDPEPCSEELYESCYERAIEADDLVKKFGGC